MPWTNSLVERLNTFFCIYGFILGTQLVAGLFLFVQLLVGTTLLIQLAAAGIILLTQSVELPFILLIIESTAWNDSVRVLNSVTVLVKISVMVKLSVKILERILLATRTSEIVALSVNALVME